MWSTLENRWIDGPELTADYWYRNLRGTVSFTDGIAALAGQGHRTFVEVSPHPVLVGPVQESAEDTVEAAGQAAGAGAVLATGTLRRGDGSRADFLTSLAGLHVSGVPVDLGPVFAGGRVVELPTYAFQRRRYWLAASPRSSDPAPVTGDLFHVAWTPVARATGQDAPDPVLLGEDVYGLGLARHADPAALDPAATPTVLACLAPVPADAALPDAVRAATGWTLGLLRDWLDRPESADARLTLVTRGATGDDPDPVHAAVWGLVRSAQAEHPGQFGLLDLPADAPAPDAAALRAALATGEPQLALRNGTLLAARLVRTPRPARTEADAGDTGGALARGTVLVTGGTGTLGAHTARHLVTAHGVRHLLLTSRRGPDAPGTEALVRELEALGATVTVAGCDLADRAALGALLASVPADRPLSGVVHTAGVLDDALLLSLTPAQLDRVLRPKVDAVANLHELTAHQDLAVFVLFSSAAATLGSAGQAGYGAANAFLDAFAAWRRARGLPGVAIGWGLWAERSGMTGGLAEAELARMVSGGVAPLETATGLALLDAALADGRPALVAAALDPAAIAAQAAPGPVPALLRELCADAGPARTAQAGPAGAATTDPEDGAEAPAERLVRRLAATAPARREAVLLELVRATSARLLGHDGPADVDPHRRFLELGFDSQTALALRNRLGAATGVRLPVNAVFDLPSPELLARHLHERLADRLGAAGDPAAGTADDAADGDQTDRTGQTEGPLAALYWQACERGSSMDALDLLKVVARFQPSFTAATAAEHVPEPVRLSPGSESGGESGDDSGHKPGGEPPLLFCLPSFGPVSGPHEYARFAAALHGTARVLVLPQPGFLAGEPLPADLEALTALHAAAVRRAAGGRPYALVGRSAGGWVAHAVAARLERDGDRPAAVALLDTYDPDYDQLPALEPSMTAAMQQREGRFSLCNDVRLAAMGAYHRAFGGWRPTAVQAPTLLVRAADPWLEEIRETAGWRSVWSLPHTAVDAPGDHFSLLEDHADTTAKAVLAWLAEPVPAVASDAAA
jgi:thioesterase domain-containing protein